MRSGSRRDARSVPASPSDAGGRAARGPAASAPLGGPAAREEERRVRPLGGEVRRRRHERRWSPRRLIDAIAHASRRATGIPATITPSLLAGIEERDEAISYETLCLLAAGFDCDPVDLLADDAPPAARG